MDPISPHIETGGIQIIMVNARTLQQLLIEGREHAGMNQQEAATKMEVSQPHLSRVERGERDITASQLKRFIALYGLDERQAWELYIEAAKKGATMPDDEKAILEAYRQEDLSRMIRLFQKRYRATA
jgi:transcriptional regulator with XRE-family HTH domain